RLEDVIESAGDAPELPGVDIDPDDPATIMYTSGTTGAPRGAGQTHRNHCTNIMHTDLAGALSAAMAGSAPGSGEGDVASTGAAGPDAPPATVSLQTFPFFHIGGLSGLYASTAFGATLICMYKWDPAEAVRIVVDEGVTS